MTLVRAPELPYLTHTPLGGVPVPRGEHPDVLFLSASGQLGGAERALLDLVAGLRARDPRQRISVLVAAPGPLEQELAALGVDVLQLGFPGQVARLGDSAASGRAGALARLAGRLAASVPATVTYLARLRALLREQAPAIVHSNGFKFHVLGALAKPEGSRLVWHLHDFTSNRALMARLLRGLAGRCDAAIANSRSVADDARAVLGARVPVTPAYNAVDLARFAPEGDRVDLDTLSGLPPAPDGTVRVGLVATLAHWKGHDVFLRAVARLPRDLPWRAYVVSGAVYQTAGSQQSLDALRSLATSLEIADRVGFPGFVKDAPGVMRALDVVVHASTQPEPFGLVIAEAMAAGRAVVVSGAGGAAELVREGETALVHPPGDEVTLGRRIAELVADTGLRARLGAAAREEAQRRFERGRLADEVAAVHDALRPARRPVARRRK